MSNFLQNLTNIGLNLNQAKTYLSLLNLGKASVIDLSKDSGVNRTTVYDNLRVLEKLGLSRTIYENDKKFYMAESPKKLSNVLLEKQSLIDIILPGLIGIYNQKKTRPKISILEGKKGLRKAHELSLKYNFKRKTKWFGEVDTLFSWLPKKEIQEYVDKRKNLGISNRIITTNRILQRKNMYSYQKNKENLRRIKYFEGMNNINTALFNFDDYVCIIPSSNEGYVIIIESAEFRITFDQLFNFLWELGVEVN